MDDLSNSFSNHTAPKLIKKEKGSRFPLSNSKFSIPRSSYSQQLLQTFEALIQEHYIDDQLKIGDIAKKMNITKNQLYRKIKALTSKSPIAFLRSYRLEKAIELLENKPDMNISQIAYRTGFNDPNYFSRTFSENIGMTPSELRRSLQLAVGSGSGQW